MFVYGTWKDLRNQIYTLLMSKIIQRVLIICQQYLGLRHITLLPQAKKGHLEKDLLRVKGKDASSYTWNLSGMAVA